MHNRWSLYEMLHTSVGEAKAGRAIAAARKDAWPVERRDILFPDLPGLFRPQSAS